MAAGVTESGADKVKPTKAGKLLAHALDAINVLNSRSGSSVKAILKHLKGNGYEVPDDKRFARSLFKMLQKAQLRGEVQRVKQSYKLTPEAKKHSKAMEKMKERAKLKKQKEKESEAKAAEKKKAKEAAKKQKASEKEKLKKKKETERKTKEPKVKKNAKDASKTDEAGEAMTEAEKPKKTTKKAKAATAAENSTNKSKSHEKSKSRKSIGTLAQGKPAAKVESKRIRQLVAGRKPKGMAALEDIEAGDDAPTQSSTPIVPGKQARKGRAAK
ncbi:hypothetical protein KR222_007846 [Zaprionus bogoriensis]|nr:hypothetical protein KR222_007846 [Zaprionus bogoriensis]